MGDYNFDNLSPYDFELLIRDLIQSAEGIKLRSFAPGRDRGIDLHGWESRQRPRAVIVQCKHMAHSPFANIRTSVREEKAKLDRLKRKPGRYILALTKPLTSENVDELFEILQPYCLSANDILDGAAIEQLLGSNEAVLHRHYKLWITSTPILQRILHAGIYTRSESYKEGLLRKSRTFVQPGAFSVARSILKDYHSCIISGPPGVGKTTLAEMLCLDYLAQDFELVVISEDVNEGDDVYAPDRKQVFIYDDFLGRTDIRKKLGKNEDNRIIQFIRRVQRSAGHRFILTTREYILRAAQQRYERLDTDEFDVLKCVIKMENYSQFQKGLILYQHLAFSENIAREDIEDLVRSRSYLKIIEHDNYTPRHITDALDAIKRRKNEAARDVARR
jgi:Restriction endonuclease